MRQRTEEPAFLQRFNFPLTTWILAGSPRELHLLTLVGYTPPVR